MKLVRHPEIYSKGKFKYKVYSLSPSPLEERVGVRSERNLVKCSK